MSLNALTMFSYSYFLCILCHAEPCYIQLYSDRSDILKHVQPYQRLYSTHYHIRDICHHIRMKDIQPHQELCSTILGIYLTMSEDNHVRDILPYQGYMFNHIEVYAQLYRKQCQDITTWGIYSIQPYYIRDTFNHIRDYALLYQGYLVFSHMMSIFCHIYQGYVFSHIIRGILHYI